MEVSRTSRRHLPILDGLRGLAILAVIVCHVNHAFGGPWISGRVSGPIAMVFGWGWIGVDLFFVLSGFLITGILFEAKNSDGYLVNFYARRALRIMPLYYGFLALVITLNRLQWLTSPWISLDRLISLGTYTYNLNVGLTGKAIGGMHHFWSLAVEEHFYLLWPFVVGAFRRRSLMCVCVLGAAASLLLRVVVVCGCLTPMAAFFLTPCRLDGLLVGSFLALAWRSEVDWAIVRRGALNALWGSGSLLLGIAFGQRHFLPDVDQKIVGHEAAVNGDVVITVGVATVAIFFGSLVAIALDSPVSSRLRRILEMPGLQALGKYSYGIYVFHALILIGSVHIYRLMSPVPFFICKPLAVVWVSTASFVVACVSYHLFEVHFLRLKRLFQPLSSKSQPVIPLKEPRPSNA